MAKQQNENKIVKTDVIELNTLFTEAIKTGNVEVVERLIKIREELKKEKSKENYYRSLSQLQSELGPIEPNCVVYNKDNTIRYRYASLDKINEQIKPLLVKYGFTITYNSEKISDKILRVTCRISHTDGHSEQASIDIPFDNSAYMSDIQKTGSTLSYARRYALMLALNIVADQDIDGNIDDKKTDEIKIKKVVHLDNGTKIEQNDEKKQLINKIRELYKEAIRLGKISRNDFSDYVKTIYKVSEQEIWKLNSEQLRNIINSLEKNIKED